MRCFVTGGSGFIGTNLIEDLLRDSHDVLNVDINAPRIHAHHRRWKHLDILDGDGVRRSMSDFAPTHVIHLAARADTDGTTLAEYAANTDGTARVLEAIAACPTIERAIITSTQYVNQAGPPKHDLDYSPYTVYGQSKVITEQLTRATKLPCVWTIVRPTNIWGPWHPRYPVEFWSVVARGLYVHPGRQRIIRSYGYVGNVTHQILKICEAPEELVSNKTYYVGDEPIELLDWVNGFSRAQTGRAVRIAPRSIVRALALGGDVLKRIGIRFPITSSRFASMTTSNSVLMAATFDAFGPPPYSLSGGIRETVEWMRHHAPALVSVD